MPIETEVFISDTHFPFHDPQAWGLALQIVKEINPEIVFLGGDIVDFYATSSFDKDPNRALQLQYELDTAAAELYALREVTPKARWLFMPGNHEARLDRYLRHHPEMFNLRALNLAKLLGLDELGCEFIPHGAGYRIGHLYHFHGDEARGGYVFPARNVYLKQQASQIFGHYHRAQVFYNRLVNGDMHGSWANPCLCLRDQEYVTGVSQWQQGFSVVTYYQLGLFHVNPVVFFSGQQSTDLHAVYNGHLFTQSR